MKVADVATRLDALIVESGFSGVVRVDRAGETVLQRSAGWAHRAYRIPMTVDTRLAMASGSKGFTALVVLSLAADGTLPLATRARELLGDDLPLIDDRVTVEHLLAHRSGIGDYLDESGGYQIDDYVLAVPVHTLVDSSDYLPVLDGHPQSSHPGERFAYNNAGFVVLAILAERAAGTAFVDLVQQRVCGPAKLTDTAYLRSDELPERTALGYLGADGDRSNVLHLPVRGSGDGGAYTTVADVHRLWAALRDGAILDPAALTAAWQPRSDVPAEASPLRPRLLAARHRPRRDARGIRRRRLLPHGVRPRVRHDPHGHRQLVRRRLAPDPSTRSRPPRLVIETGRSGRSRPSAAPRSGESVHDPGCRGACWARIEVSLSRDRRPSAPYRLGSACDRPDRVDVRPRPGAAPGGG